jgi:hypothetical protein
MSDITIKLSVEEARALVQPDPHVYIDDASRTADRKLMAALAAHERDEKRKALGLPWAAAVHRRLPEGSTWLVMSAALDCDGHTAIRLAGDLTEPQARLMAAAPDLAEALEAAIEFMDPDASDCQAQRDFCEGLREALRKAGWL